MKKIITLLVMVFFILIKTNAHENLILNHVMYWGWEEPGYIESASLLIEPKGLYAECTLVLDFSTGGIIYDDYDSLEVVMNFNLPEESQVRELYLWINNEPVRGLMFDRWTASLIYESIVERRIDPAILTKVGANEYNIKIFPLLTELPRKIKIKYIAPIQNILANNSMVITPFNILKLSEELPDSFRLAFKGDSVYGSPRILENEEVDFNPVLDIDFGLCEMACISDLEQYSSISMVFNENSDNPLHMLTYRDEEHNNNYYELAFNHSSLFDVNRNRKAVFLVDYIDENCSAYSKEDILNDLEYSISNTFTPLDSFNVLFSGMVTSFPSTEWVPADSASISDFFGSLDPELMNSYSNMPTLLVDGINYLKNKDADGSLVLVASSNSNGSGNEANALINDYMESLEGTEIPIHIIDLDDQYYYTSEMHYIGGQYFRGNEYLYTRLSQLTVGEYYSIRQYSLLSMLEKVNHRLSGYFKSLEVFIQSEGGYAFSNYTLQGSESLTYNDESFCIVGQYVGEPPFYISIFGQDSDDQVYYTIDTIKSNEIFTGDTIIQKVWAAQKIKDLYSMEQSTQVINQIINTSIKEYILTNYTALLVLEPGFQIPEELGENEEWDDVFPTDLIDNTEVAEAPELSNYPNPCNESTTITYSLTNSCDVRIIVINSLGQIITTLIDEAVVPGEYTVTYDTSDLDEGIYQCLLIIDGAIAAKIRMVVI